MARGGDFVCKTPHTGILLPCMYLPLSAWRETIYPKTVIIFACTWRGEQCELKDCEVTTHINADSIITMHGSSHDRGPFALRDRRVFFLTMTKLRMRETFCTKSLAYAQYLYMCAYACMHIMSTNDFSVSPTPSSSSVFGPDEDRHIQRLPYLIPKSYMTRGRARGREAFLSSST